MKQGQHLTAVYFVNKGLVQMSTHDGMQSTLTNTENFGLDDYYAGCVAHATPQVSRSAKAITYCDLMLLEVRFCARMHAHQPKCFMDTSRAF